MKIKKLEFKESTNEAFVQTQIGDYSITEQIGNYEVYFNNHIVYDKNHRKRFNSLDDAINVAQRDFEYRVKQCIEEE